MSENFRINMIAQSVFEKNYEQIPESKKEILSQKYNCSICLEIIKHENPFLCYECQKIFHHSCLKHWNERQKQLNKVLSCPNCRNELAFEEWKVLRNYDEIRTKDAQILNQLGKSFNSNEYIDKSMDLFKIIINKLNIIHSKIDSQKNYKLNNLIEEFKYHLINPSIDEISTAIIEELDLLEEYIQNVKEGIQQEEIKYKNEINLKYLTEKEGKQKIFGDDFVKNNINNISLIINGNKSPLVREYDLKKGENNVKICIKNMLTNLSYMFYFCEALYNMNELKYLNTNNITDFSWMFANCKISNIKPLENWDTSKSKTFSYMFYNCKLVTNIKAVKNWDVSRCKDFSCMLRGCNISDITPLESWNVSNGINFNGFLGYNSVSDIKPLEKWDVSNAKNLGSFIDGCSNIIDISPIKNWNISKCENLSSLFYGCENLSDITPLKNWNISKCENLSCLFYGCENLSDITPLKNWNLSKCEDLRYLFYSCSKLSDLSPLKNWDVSNVKNFECSFYNCSSIKDIKPLENWNVSNGKTFYMMFDKLELLTDISPLKKWKALMGNEKFENMLLHIDH